MMLSKALAAGIAALALSNDANRGVFMILPRLLFFPASSGVIGKNIE
jgi:hypothetical protein